MKSWNDRLNTPGINGVKPTPRTVGDVVEGQPMLVPTARQVDDAHAPAAQPSDRLVRHRPRG